MFTKHEAQGEKIGILADDGQALREREFRYRWIGGGLHPDIANMKGIGKDVG